MDEVKTTLTLVRVSSPSSKTFPRSSMGYTPTDVPKRSGGILDPFYRIAATPAGVTVKDIPKNTERLSTQTLYPDTKHEK